MQPFGMSEGDRDFVRVPGFFRRSELGDVLELDTEFVLEDAGKMDDGTSVLFLFRRSRPLTKKEGN